MKITDYMKEHVLYLDGGTGTMLQSLGLSAGELPERWNITHPDRVREVHRAYFDAGCNVVSANTFGANCLKLDDGELDDIIRAAVGHVRYAMDLSAGSQKKFVALDIGPTGRMLKPLGDLDFEDAIEIFAKTVRLGVKYGVDLFFIQTMNDSLETKAALLAVKENSDLPVFVANAYGEDGKLLTGADPRAMVAMLEGMGADAIGVNCSLGPRALSSVIDRYLRYSSLPIIVKPNAGLPTFKDGEAVYTLSADEFATEMAEIADRGARIIGGCCGTTPEYIKRMVERTKNLSPRPIEKKNHTLVSSYTHAQVIGERPLIIGERINPTGKPKLRAALKEGNMDHILGEAVKEEGAGAHILDVNVGIPEVDEVALLPYAICEIQAVTDLPLQIDTSNASAMEAALRRYNGKALINSVSGKAESLRAILPLMKKYGGVAVALTLDENGIPDTAEGRLDIAKKIIAEAQRYGIDKKNLVFDPLAMAVSADQSAAKTTLKALDLIRRETGCYTLLGVSNASFGLPRRDVVNAVYLTEALCHGLSAAIVNPCSAEVMKAYYAHLALSGMDEGCSEYISFAEGLSADNATVAPIAERSGRGECDTLSAAIECGLKSRAVALCEQMLKICEPMDIVNSHIIPALNKVGEGYEIGKIYLPGLLMSAESASAAFEVIKAAMPAQGGAEKCKIVLATVKGDIHDIGKNIVKLILENYGFGVIDLGKSVAKEKIVEAVMRYNAPIVGLSALMTTTVPEMEDTIRELRIHAPECRVMVGGAVLTEEYAVSIGADAYAKDAIEAVKCAERLISKK